MRWIRYNDAGTAVIEYGVDVAGMPKLATTMTAAGWIAYDGILPTSRLSIADGAVVELPEPPATTEWVSKEAFVAALSALVDAATLQASIADAAALKTGVMGLALLTTDAAPGGVINLLDSRVEPWLATYGLTLDQVRLQMTVDDTTVEGDDE